MAGGSYGGADGLLYGGSDGGQYGTDSGSPGDEPVREDLIEKTLQLDIQDAISANPVRTHTGLSDWTMTLPADYSWEDDRFAEVLLYYGNTFLFRGKLETVSTNEGASTTTLSGRGVGKELLDDEDSISFSHVPAHEAIETVWQDYTNFLPTVTSPTVSTVATDELIQQGNTDAGLSQFVSPADTDPIGVQNDNIELLQSCFFSEGESWTSQNGATSVSDASYSNGSAAHLDTDGDWIEFEFNVDYTIPAEQVGVQVRQEASDCPETGYFVNGRRIDTLKQFATTLILGWDDVGDGWASGGEGYTGGDLTPEDNPHTVRIEVEGAGSGEDITVDCVALYDERYSYTFDDSVDANGYLSGPELYPDEHTIQLDAAATSYNVTEAFLDTSWDDTSGVQELALSNDGGATWDAVSNAVQQTTTFSNTYGTQAIARLTFGRYGSRSSASPTDGYQGQKVLDYRLEADGNDLSVINDRTFSGNLLKILQKLHGFAGMRFTIIHSPSNKPVHSYVPGEVIKPASWDVVDRKRKLDVRGYANRVIVKGKLKEDGTRYEGIARDMDEQAKVGGTVTFETTDTTLESDEDCGNAARSILEDKVDADSLTGTLDITPKAIDPGFSYEIPEWGVTLALEKVDYSESSGDATGTLDFESTEGLADTVSGLNRSTSDLEDSV